MRALAILRLGGTVRTRCRPLCTTAVPPASTQVRDGRWTLAEAAGRVAGEAASTWAGRGEEARGEWVLLGRPAAADVLRVLAARGLAAEQVSAEAPLPPGRGGGSGAEGVMEVDGSGAAEGEARALGAGWDVVIAVPELRAHIM